jgi:hypothetical protein
VRIDVGLGIATIGGFASTLLTGTPAYAHFTEIRWNGNQAYVNASHDHIWVYDGNCNGRDAYVQWESGTAVGTMRDGNGCSTGYPDQAVGGAGVDRYRLCEVGGGCSGWKSA